MIPTAASKVSADKRHKKTSDAGRSSGAQFASMESHSGMLALQHSAGNQAVNAVVNSPGGGAPMPVEMRGEMEQRFGEDFSRVRLHTDAHAAQSAAELSARAYTLGNNIVFNEGRFNPTTASGKRLFAHELAHVVQQRRGGTTPWLNPVAFHEQAAGAAANAIIQGHTAVNVVGGTAVGVAREPEDGEPLAKGDLKARLEEIEQVIERQPMKANDRAITKKAVSKIRELAKNDPESASRMLEGLEIRLEQTERRKTTYSEAPNLEDRALLEQTTPHPKEIKKAVIMEGAKLGELGGTDKAKEEGIIVHETWEPPQKFKGDFGQGIDKKGERGNKSIIIEDKYGSSTLGVGEDGTVQMSNRWVGKKIAELQLEGDTKAARDLLQASQEGRLQGVVYSTQQKGGKDVTSRRDGAYLRDKLGDESISKSGLITYAPSKVYGAYKERLKQLEDKHGVSLPPLMQPKSRKSATPGSALSTIPGPPKKPASPPSPVSPSKAPQNQIGATNKPKTSIKVSPAPATIPGPPIEPGGILMEPGSKAPEAVPSIFPSAPKPLAQSKASPAAPPKSGAQAPIREQKMTLDPFSTSVRETSTFLPDRYAEREAVRARSVVGANEAYAQGVGGAAFIIQSGIMTIRQKQEWDKAAEDYESLRPMIERLHKQGEWVVVYAVMDVPKAFDVANAVAGYTEEKDIERFSHLYFDHGPSRELAFNPPPRGPELRAATLDEIVHAKPLPKLPEEGRKWKEYVYKELPGFKDPIMLRMSENQPRLRVNREGMSGTYVSEGQSRLLTIRFTGQDINVSGADQLDGKRYDFAMTLWDSRLGLMRGTFTKNGSRETINSVIMVRDDGSLIESYSAVYAPGVETAKTAIWTRRQ